MQESKIVTYFAALFLAAAPALGETERPNCGEAITDADLIQAYAIGAQHALTWVALLADKRAGELDAEIPNVSEEHAEALRQRAFVLRAFGRPYHVYDKLSANELVAQLVRICASNPDEPIEGTLARLIGERYR